MILWVKLGNNRQKILLPTQFTGRTNSLLAFSLWHHERTQKNTKLRGQGIAMEKGFSESI